MRLKEEVKEAMAKAAEEKEYPALAKDIRLEKTTTPTRTLAEDIATAALAVLNQYEEVEVEECCASFVVSRGSHWLRMPDDRFTGRGSHNAVPRTIYMRKPEPAPDVEELARRAVKAYRDGVLDQRETMAALEDALDK